MEKYPNENENNPIQNNNDDNLTPDTNESYSSNPQPENTMYNNDVDNNNVNNTNFEDYVNEENINVADNSSTDTSFDSSYNQNQQINNSDDNMYSQDYNNYQNYYNNPNNNHNSETQDIDLNNNSNYNDNYNANYYNENQDNEEYSSTNLLNNKDADKLNNSNTPYQQSTYTQQPTESKHQYKAPPKPKKAKKPISAGVLAVVVVITILISGTLGVAGGVIAPSIINANDNSGSSPTQSTSTTSQPVPTGPGMTTEEIVTAVADTVVEITTEIVETGSFNQQFIESGAGSGVIISDDGYIMTNNHVIEGATSINVTLRDGTSYEAELVGTAEPNLDIALIKIDAKNLHYAEMGDSDTLQVGEEIVVIGNPLGQLGGSVTDGIISALNRDLNIDGTTMNVLQTNAAINPGNSGGGMFNSQGQLVGIVVAKSTGDEVEGLGFVIPINQAKAVVDDLKEYGYVRGNIQVGMSLVDITNEQMAMMYRVDELGVYIQSVELNSAAFQAGLQSGDRIVSIDGQEVSTAQEVKDIFSEHEVGDVVTVKVARNGETGDLQLTLTESIPEDIEAQSSTQQDEAENIFNSVFE